MNRSMITKMRHKKVKVRPLARRVDDTGRELIRMDDIYVIQDSSWDKVTLFNSRTHHTFPLGVDHIREYLTDHTGGTDGVLWLKSQIVLRGRGVSVEPLEQSR